MEQDVVEETVRLLRYRTARFPQKKSRPVFLFLCGGDDSDARYICRRDVERYVRSKKGLERVLIVKPETLLNDFADLISEIDLLDLEAIIAELSDAILLFDESSGSICELGAFAMADATREIMTACIPFRYEGNSSFIVQGPVRHIEQCNSLLSSIIYLDTTCPFSSIELERYFDSLLENVARQHKREINRNKASVSLGSFCRECLDLISIFEPIEDLSLLSLYKQIKGFDSIKFSISTMSSIPRNFSYKVVFAYLASTGLVDYKDGMLTMTGEVPGYYMFLPSARDDIQMARAAIVSAKRKGHRGWDNVCPT